MRFFIEFSYKGTNYHGWQEQPNAKTVQQEINKALSVICNDKNKIESMGAGRTDAGVHAKQMFAHFDCGFDCASPNIIFKLNNFLPNDIAINLYPSLCFFEGTHVSAGRGTEMQFQVFGSPYSGIKEFSFTPKPNEGAKYPKHESKICYGKDLRQVPKQSLLNLEWLSNMYANSTKKDKFFNSFFVKLAGTKELQEQIKSGMNYRDIRKSWLEGLKQYDKMRQQYVIY